MSAGSWWDLGEGSGFFGDELALFRIGCAFCQERGNWELVHRSEKKKPNSNKTLRFDTYRCGNCGGFVMVLWSGGEFASRNGMHDFKVLPWPTGEPTPPEAWPDEVARFWVQARKSLAAGSLDAAAVMTRSALQVALRAQDATGHSLKNEIDDLAARGLLPPIMKEWAHELRVLGNDSAHPAPGQGPPTAQDVRDAVEFFEFLCEYLYSLPKSIEQFRSRRDPA